MSNRKTNSEYAAPEIKTLDTDALLESMGPAMAGSASVVEPPPPLPPAGTRD